MGGLSPLGFGVALSGGGSRAAAFHCGTLRALVDLGWLDRVDVVSTVSGGSVFGGAWMAARLRREPEDAFLGRMARELERGFVLRSLGARALKLLLPGFTRTDLLADTFDRVFLAGATLDRLPDRPALCLNVTVLNHAQVGKLSKKGFQTPWLTGPPAAAGSTPVALPAFPLARAVAASAAFPVGLPPVALRLPGEPPRTGPLAGARTLWLTDGGVLENLGAQTLLASTGFGTWDLLVSDAGVRETAWTRSMATPFRSLLISILSAGTLERILTTMNDKENRSMRAAVARDVEATWVSQVARDPARQGDLAEHAAGSARPRRKLYFARVDQTWSRFLSGIPRWRWIELGVRNVPTASPAYAPADAAAVLAAHGVALGAAKDLYRELGGDDRAAALNRVKTGFTALAPGDVRDLALHARWQVHLARAVYG
ncbi:MAG TPA: patatin-like phospholipase family protein [Haliangiales bacterium]|nr:patatin-like phospholipase family protein [Haliangiales bacterium]